jgi:hypothetical protein
MHASIACLLLYEDYVWVSLGNAMKAKQSKAKPVRPIFPLALNCQWSYLGTRQRRCSRFFALLSFHRISSSTWPITISLHHIAYRDSEMGMQGNGLGER